MLSEAEHNEHAVQGRVPSPAIPGALIVVRNSPVLHALQKCAPGIAGLLRSWSAYSPEGQFVHEVAPRPTLYSTGTPALGKNAPCGIAQEAHNDIPAAPVYSPSGQSVQAELPVVALDFPAVHKVQVPPLGPEFPTLHTQLAAAVLEAGEFDLAGHGVHGLAVPLTAYVPASQGVHVDAPAALDVPAAQGVHVAAPAALEVPAPQGAHELCPSKPLVLVPGEHLGQMEKISAPVGNTLTPEPYVPAPQGEQELAPLTIAW